MGSVASCHFEAPATSGWRAGLDQRRRTAVDPQRATMDTAQAPWQPEGAHQKAMAIGERTH